MNTQLIETKTYKTSKTLPAILLVTEDSIPLGESRKWETQYLYEARQIFQFLDSVFCGATMIQLRKLIQKNMEIN